MTIRKTKGIAATAVFTAASLLHFFIIAAVFLHFSVDRQEPVQTRFVIQSLPVPKADPAVPQKPQHVQKPALKQPSSVQQERHAEPQEATAAPESSTADSAEPVYLPVIYESTNHFCMYRFICAFGIVLSANKSRYKL